MNDAENNINTAESPIQLEHDSKQLLCSTVLLLTAIAINVLSILVFNFISHLLIYFPKINLLRILLHVKTWSSLFISAIPFFLILFAFYRIINLLKSKVHFFFIIFSVVLFLFYFYLKILNLWHYIIISIGRGFSESNWLVIALLLLPPLGILSCHMIGIRLNSHFSTFLNYKKAIQWSTFSLAVIWFSRIVFAYVLWLKNSQTIEFSLRYLVFYSHRWQLESVFYWRFFRYLTIAILLWQVWLFFLLWHIKSKCRNFLAENKTSVSYEV